MRNQKGITLITLMLTMIIIFILGAISVYTGVEAYKTIKIQNFMAQMRVIQERVNLICEDWKNWDGYDVSGDDSADANNFNLYIDAYLKEKNAGMAKQRASETTYPEFHDIINSPDKTILTGNDKVITNYYHFTSEELEQYLGLKDLKIDVIINFSTRNFVEKDGVESINTAGEVKIYYVLDELVEAQRVTETIIENVVKDEEISEYYTKLETSIIENNGDSKKIAIYSNMRVEFPIKKVEKIIGTYTNLEEISNSSWENITYTSTSESIVVSVQENGIYNFRITDNKDNIFYSKNAVDIELANAPKLEIGMQPITFGNSGEIEEISKDNSQWYDYSSSQKKWANVKLKDGSIFVWIPRFAYKINSNKTISIKFLEDATTKTFDGNLESGYTVHPAFTKGSNLKNGEWQKDITGIWVAKFNATIFKLGENQIVSIAYGRKPTKVKNFYSALEYCRNMHKIESYGFSNITDQDFKTDLTFAGTGFSYDTHLIKNSEMGAVLYLAWSSYGRNAENITSNNNGIAGGYETANGIFTRGDFSTTKNAYGVYDIIKPGGEYVASGVESTIIGISAKQSGKEESFEEILNTFSSDVEGSFDSIEITKESEKIISERTAIKRYFTTYSTSESSNAIIGDGIKDLKTSWGLDDVKSNYPTHTKPVFIRGYNSGNIFAYKAAEFESEDGYYIRPVIIVN